MKHPLSAGLLLACLLAGCASEPRVLQLDAAPQQARVFPPPQTQEVPRYRYLGQLLGESNFRAKNAESAGSGRKLLAWIVGLAEGREQPVTLQRPQAGVVDRAGRVLVTDVSRNAIYVFDEAKGKLDVWEQATRRERFAAPIGIALGRGSEILVCDADLGRVFRLAADGTPLGEIGAGRLQRPTGIARDAQQGRIFVADTHAHAIQVFDDDGKLLATWGQRGDGPGELNYPTHLAWRDGMLLVADSMNARIQGFDGQGRPVLRVGERGLYVGNLVRPKGVAADDEGNIYVVESMHDTLLVYDRNGRFLLPLGGSDVEGGGFYLPAGVWLDERGRVFVADMFNGRVAVFQFLGGH